MVDVLLKTPKSHNKCKTLFQKLWNVIKEQQVTRLNELLENVVLKVLFWTETSVELSKSKQDSPLIYFCRMRSLPVVKALLELGANIDHVGEYGKTAMHYVASGIFCLFVCLFVCFVLFCLVFVLFFYKEI